MKKLMGFIVILTFVCMSSNVVARPNVQNYEEALELHKLGLYEGISPREFVADLENTLNRQTLATLYVRLVGEEEDSVDMTLKDANDFLSETFIDGHQVDSWAARQMAYAVQKGYFVGYPDQSIKPHREVVGKELSSIILKYLEYDFTFETSSQILSELANFEESLMKAMDSKDPLLKDHCVFVFQKILSLDFAKKNTSILDRLIEKGQLTYEDVKSVSTELSKTLTFQNIINDIPDYIEKIEVFDSEKNTLDLTERFDTIIDIRVHFSDMVDTEKSPEFQLVKVDKWGDSASFGYSPVGEMPFEEWSVYPNGALSADSYHELRIEDVYGVDGEKFNDYTFKFYTKRFQESFSIQKVTHSKSPYSDGSEKKMLAVLFNKKLTNEFSVKNMKVVQHIEIVGDDHSVEKDLTDDLTMLDFTQNNDEGRVNIEIPTVMYADVDQIVKYSVSYSHRAPVFTQDFLVPKVVGVHPVLLSGYIFGGTDSNGAWLSDHEIAEKASGYEIYQVYGSNEFIGQYRGAGKTENEFQHAIINMDEALKKEYNVAIASQEELAWQKMEEISVENEAYVKISEDFLESRGVNSESIIKSIHEVDLDGDEEKEALMILENTHKIEGEFSSDMDDAESYDRYILSKDVYSYVILRKQMNGDMKNIVLDETLYKKDEIVNFQGIRRENMVKFVGDVDRDDQMEIILGYSIFNTGASKILDVQGDQVIELANESRFPAFGY
jgi:hypothetical protein